VKATNNAVIIPRIMFENLKISYNKTIEEKMIKATINMIIIFLFLAYFGL